SQQYGTRADGSIRRVNEVSSSQLENKISDLTTFVRQMAVGQMQSTGAYGICSCNTPDLPSRTSEALPPHLEREFYLSSIDLTLGAQAKGTILITTITQQKLNISIHII
ncbi:hypothetical protein ABN254_21600, partial [Providencia rettgeri]